MCKIDWKNKISSRKFWITLIGFVTAILFAFNVDAVQIEKIVGVISAMSLLVVYILAEGYIDGKREEGDIIIETNEAMKEIE